jgi:hypothetical protein
MLPIIINHGNSLSLQGSEGPLEKAIKKRELQEKLEDIPNLKNICKSYHLGKKHRVDKAQQRADWLLQQKREKGKLKERQREEEYDADDASLP